MLLIVPTLIEAGYGSFAFIYLSIAMNLLYIGFSGSSNSSEGSITSGNTFRKIAN